MHQLPSPSCKAEDDGDYPGSQRRPVDNLLGLAEPVAAEADPRKNPMLSEDDRRDRRHENGEGTSVLELVLKDVGKTSNRDRRYPSQ